MAPAIQYHRSNATTSAIETIDSDMRSSPMKVLSIQQRRQLRAFVDLAPNTQGPRHVCKDWYRSDGKWRRRRFWWQVMAASAAPQHYISAIPFKVQFPTLELNLWHMINSSSQIKHDLLTCGLHIGQEITRARNMKYTRGPRRRNLWHAWWNDG
jgi:hypothetical protein